MTALSVVVRGTLTLGDTTVVKIDVVDGDFVIDGAWGQAREIDAWLKRKGYPTVSWSWSPMKGTSP